MLWNGEEKQLPMVDVIHLWKMKQNITPEYWIHYWVMQNIMLWVYCELVACVFTLLTFLRQLLQVSPDMHQLLSSSTYQVREANVHKQWELSQLAMRKAVADIIGQIIVGLIDGFMVVSGVIKKNILEGSFEYPLAKEGVFAPGGRACLINSR